MNHSSASILLVEDNPDHQELILEALEEANISENVLVKSDGEKAWEFLINLLDPSKGNINEKVQTKFPRIILLDINLPKISGLELLKLIKENQQLKIIPVIILTTSRNERDIYQAYKHHANSYLSKPINYKEFTKMIKSLTDYWYQTNTGLF